MPTPAQLRRQAGPFDQAPLWSGRELVAALRARNARLAGPADITEKVASEPRPCHFCGVVYAGSGPILVARVLEHLSRECPEMGRRGELAADELVLRAQWGDK